MAESSTDTLSGACSRALKRAIPFGNTFPFLLLINPFLVLVLRKISRLWLQPLPVQTPGFMPLPHLLHNCLISDHFAYSVPKFL
ncbi:hypothetical protein ACAH71_004596 [Escherichia coli]